MAARLSPRAKQRPSPRAHWLDHLLDPIDRLAETIYSILILLTFTFAFRIITPDDASQPVPERYSNELLIAMLGAALAWGMIDGVMHVLLGVLQRGERHRLLRQFQAAPSEEARVAVIADELDDTLEPITSKEERERLYKSIADQLRDAQAQPIGLRRDDFAGALGCVLVTILAVLPSLVPLLLLGDTALAVRLSNVVSFAMLFYAGYRWGQYTEANPWRIGFSLVTVGVIMMLIALPLGG